MAPKAAPPSRPSATFAPSCSALEPRGIVREIATNPTKAPTMARLTIGIRRNRIGIARGDTMGTHAIQLRQLANSAITVRSNHDRCPRRKGWGVEIRCYAGPRVRSELNQGHGRWEDEMTDIQV